MASDVQKTTLPESRDHYRKRAATAPLILTEREPKTTIKEAVWWPGDGYGGATPCRTLDEAKERARETLKLGYGQNPKKNVVHIVETTTRIIEVSIGDA